MATTGEIQAIWKILSANYVTHAKSLTPAQLEEQLQVWYAILADIPSDILRAAALQHMAGSKWFPQVAELRDIAAALLVERPATAMEEWGKVVETFSDLRYYRYADGYHEFPTFANPLTARVVAAMGWARLKESEDYTADRARFVQAYDALAARAAEDAKILPQVAAAAEAHRLGSGQERVKQLVGGVVRQIGGQR